MEEEAGELVSRGGVKKPVFAYLAGHTAPEGQRVGHAGAIIDRSTGTIESKIRALKEAGVLVGRTMEEVVSMMKTSLAN